MARVVDQGYPSIEIKSGGIIVVNLRIHLVSSGFLYLHSSSQCSSCKGGGWSLSRRWLKSCTESIQYPGVQVSKYPSIQESKYPSITKWSGNKRECEAAAQPACCPAELLPQTYQHQCYQHLCYQHRCYQTRNYNV